MAQQTALNVLCLLLAGLLIGTMLIAARRRNSGQGFLRTWWGLLDGNFASITWDAALLLFIWLAAQGSESQVVLALVFGALTAVKWVVRSARR